MGSITFLIMNPFFKGFDWDGLINSMKSIDNAQTLLPLSKFHMDVLEVQCSLPSLLNVFYKDQSKAKTTNLEIGDISILTMSKAKTQVLEFKPDQKGPFVYSFNIYKLLLLLLSLKYEFSVVAILKYPSFSSIEN